MRKPVRIGITGGIANATYSDNPSPELEQLVTRMAEMAYEQTSEPMKKKYIKVEYKDLVPGKEYIQIHPIMIKNSKDERKVFPEPEWVEEVPDHSVEMLSILNRVVGFTSLGEKVPDFLTHEIEKLLNKV
ncbi:hypothetical protein [Elizabethkingia bruuniana]|uniref:hypothetical protein n=1 Tax=Elizabethkingia bruuniana TaxID=1756149 RepID=UPI00398C7030